MWPLADVTHMTDDVLVLATGGTIASTTDGDGATPTETGDELLGALPDLRDRVAVEQVAQRSSPDMDFETLDRLRRRVEAHAASSDAGVVVTHGTDTMEESAYYLDLTRDGGPPVVFTGAQRRPDQPGADGPANLVDAVAAAETPAVREAGGTYVCFDGELHAARDAVKAHSWRLGAFASPGKGPVGAVTPAGFERYRELGSRSRFLPVDAPPEATVDVVSTGVGVSGRSFERAAEACDGVVLRATGLGNAPESVADAVGAALDDGLPVVVTTRCHAGGVAPVYAGGGGHALAEAGAHMAGDLHAQKARIKLVVALAGDHSERRVRDAFAPD